MTSLKPQDRLRGMFGQRGVGGGCVAGVAEAVGAVDVGGVRRGTSASAAARSSMLSST